MEYLVCKMKDDGSLFVTTRNARESMVSVLQDLGQSIDSVVLKSFPEYSLADKYKNEQQIANKIIDNL